MHLWLVFVVDNVSGTCVVSPGGYVLRPLWRRAVCIKCVDCVHTCIYLCLYFYRYSVVGFIDKNKDTLFQDFKRLLYNR